MFANGLSDGVEMLGFYFVHLAFQENQMMKYVRLYVCIYIYILLSALLPPCLSENGTIAC